MLEERYCLGEQSAVHGAYEHSANTIDTYWANKKEEKTGQK